MSTNVFNFSLEPQSFGPFSITDKTGKASSFLLREASEAGHIAYRDATMRGMMIRKEEGATAEASVTGGADADAILVARSLFRLTPGASDDAPQIENPVTLEFVKGLPRRITARLYSKVRELSGMDEDQETVEFLSKRIKSDHAKLSKLQKDGTPGNVE